MALIDEEFKKGRDYRVYHPKVFERLKALRADLNAFCSHRDLSRLSAEWNPLGVSDALEKAKKTRPTESSLRSHLLEWFDAFRELKAIHHFTKTYPKMPLEKAVDFFYTQQICLPDGHPPLTP